MNTQKMENYSAYCDFYDNLQVDKNIVFFESHNSIDFAGNMLAIAAELSSNSKYQNIQIYISYVSESKAKIETLINKYTIRCTSLIERESKEYFRILATAGYLFTDVAYYSLFRKKRGQTCVSTWHGTPLKTLGFTFCEDEYVVANQKRGFLLADYFICPNEYTWNCIRESYQLEGLFQGKVVYGGYPRNSVFFNDLRRTETRKELSTALGLTGKKIVVYMPTWRGKVIQVNDKGQTVELQELLREIDDLIPDDYMILAKLHRLNQSDLDYTGFRHIIPFPEGYDTYDVLNTVDILVTDYSSVMFDFLPTRKKIVLFCYDKNDYVENRGCYFDMNELSFPIVTDTSALIEEICGPKEYEDEKEIEKYNKYDSISSTAKLCQDIFLGEKNCACFTLEKSNKNKALICVGELNENEATDSLFFVLDKLEQYDCHISYMNHLFKEKWYKLLQFPGMNQIPLYMYQGRYSNYTNSENRIVGNIRTAILGQREVSAAQWKILEKIGKREYERYQYQNKFDLFIRYAGLDIESLKWFRVYKGLKIIYIHKNMIEKAEKNLEYKVYLQRAMEKANEIHYANREIFEDAEKIFCSMNTKKIIEELY